MNDIDVTQSFGFDAILIDTSIYERNGLKLDKGLLKALYQLKRSPIDLLLPDVIFNELKHHLEKKFNEIHNLSKVISDFKDYALIDQTGLDTLENLKNSINIKNIVQEKMHTFTVNTGAVAIECGQFVNITEILEKYFSAVPPFAKEGKKKSEFPDAITLNAVEKWAETKSAKVLAIAVDPDWKTYCEQSPHIEYQEDLADVLAELNALNAPYVVLDQIESLISTNDSGFNTQIAQYITQELEDFTPDQDAESYLYWEPEWITVYFESFSFRSHECRIIEADENQIIIEADVNILINAEGEFSLSVYDSIDKDYVGLSSVTSDVETDFDSKILLTFEGEVTTQQTLDNLELTDIEILNKPRVIHFGVLEPDFHEYED